MADKKKHSTGRSIWKFLALLPSFTAIFQSLVHKLKVETWLTVKNIIILAMIAFMLACLLTATWISLLAILFFGLLKLQWTWYAAAALIVSLNVICILILCICASNVKNNVLASSLLKGVSRKRSGH